MTVALTKLEPVQLPQAPTALWYLEVTAVVTDGTPSIGNSIFIYQRNTVPGLDDLFCAVASASALMDIPLEKDATAANSYYRVDKAQFLCRSMTELDGIWETLKSDVQLLVDDWAKIPTAVPTATVTISPSA